ncbi:MAG: TIGR00159 family protein [Deltaproteobacteria bacterium RBG_13_49_15]|nr:MAG: TIGR00159 family protein [Deltaproteobacteria bacterium RBG_13_49_15]
MQTLELITNIRIQDILDILFLTAIAYYLYLWFQGTKALKALVGLVALGITFSIAQSWGLFLTTWMFQILWQVLIILLIILFQVEIRQVLERVNPFKRFGMHEGNEPRKWTAILTDACFALAKRRIGALIIIERKDRVEEHITGGVPIQGDPGPELLITLFQKESPLHDGALLIRSQKVVTAACYLPLTAAEGLPQHWGTRHRAALGLTERCDAWVIVVSEERGEISLAKRGEMISLADRVELLKFLMDAVALPKTAETTWIEKIRFFLVNRWRIKLGTLGLVSVIWLLLAGQQDFEVTLQVPVDLINLPTNMKIVEPTKPTVKVVARGLRKDASTLNARDVDIKLDLSRASLNRKTYRITKDHVALAYHRIDIVRIEPTEISFVFEQKEHQSQ